MKSIECAIEIAAPVEVVFDCIHDYERRLDWDPFLCEARLLGGATAAGVGVATACRARRAAGGGTMETVYVTYRRPDVAAVRMTRGPFYLGEFAASIRQVETAEHTTRVMYKFHLASRPAWMRPVLDPILSFVFRRETERRLVSLREHIERRRA